MARARFLGMIAICALSATAFGQYIDTSYQSVYEHNYTSYNYYNAKDFMTKRIVYVGNDTLRTIEYFAESKKGSYTKRVNYYYPSGEISTVQRAVKQIDKHQYSGSIAKTTSYTKSGKKLRVITVLTKTDRSAYPSTKRSVTKDRTCGVQDEFEQSVSFLDSTYHLNMPENWSVTRTNRAVYLFSNNLGVTAIKDRIIIRTKSNKGSIDSTLVATMKIFARKMKVEKSGKFRVNGIEFGWITALEKEGITSNSGSNRILHLTYFTIVNGIEIRFECESNYSARRYSKKLFRAIIDTVKPL